MDNEVLSFGTPSDSQTLIKVIGVGGGGGNAVTNMYNEGIKDVSFVLCNTDKQAMRGTILAHMDGGVPILMYHYVYSADNPPAALDGNYLLDTKLEEQLAYLVENDFYFPSYPEVRAFIEGEHSLPARSIVLTFDDAEAGFLNVGIPILEKYGVPATSFVICSDADAAQKVVDHRSPYVSFQSHSYGLHQAGGTIGHGGLISALTKDQIAEDLTHAQEILGTTEAFAYPFGDVTADGQQAVREVGILCAFTTQNSWAHVGDDVTALPRVRISGEYELAGFVALVNG